MDPDRSGVDDPGVAPDSGGEDYRVTVEPTAVAASDAVAELVAEWGRTVTFPDRATAERVATDLADRGTGTAWIQSAPSDPGADAYMVGREHVPGKPIDRDGDAFTCRVSADQYGALGEALVAAGSLDPALRTYVREDLPIAEDARQAVVFETDRRPPAVFAEARSRDGSGEGNGEGEESSGEGGTGNDGGSDRRGGDGDGSSPSTADDRRRWVPDCRIRPFLPGEDRPIREYWCEVKTGDGDPERSQSAAMRAKAREATVLLATVDVDDLPERYEVTVDEVDPRG